MEASSEPTPTRRARRRPLQLTDPQLSALAHFLVLYLDDFASDDGRDVPRVREIARKVDAEMDRRDIVGPVLVGRDALTGIPVTIVAPIRVPRRRR